LRQQQQLLLLLLLLLMMIACCNISKENMGKAVDAKMWRMPLDLVRRG
jgi:hypothetical protein